MSLSLDVEIHFDTTFGTAPQFTAQMQPVSMSFDTNTQKGDMVFNTAFALE